jgi:hypothetical protein
MHKITGPAIVGGSVGKGKQSKQQDRGNSRVPDHLNLQTFEFELPIYFRNKEPDRSESTRSLVLLRIGFQDMFRQRELALSGAEATNSESLVSNWQN